MEAQNIVKDAPLYSMHYSPNGLPKVLNIAIFMDVPSLDFDHMLVLLF